VSRWSAEITEASERFGVPVAWIEQVMRAESGGMTRLRGRPITSRAGAMGLMQLMPGTWREMRAALGLGSDPHHPRENILAGTAYLRAMYDRFGYPGLFAAYNAGPARYAASLASGRPLPGETRAYVAAVTETTFSSPAPPRAQPPGALFVQLRLSDALANPLLSREDTQAWDGLFAVRRR
jgi:soluble lytic murein transglycosylase-like protein